VGLAGLGLLAGIAVLVGHLRTDPLADVHAYYDAGRRLNLGLPLYLPSGDPDVADFYRYPPLLAILFRPLAMLPFEVAAGIWETLMLLAFGLTVRIVGWRFETGIALGLLALPIGWSLAIGQAQTLVTLLTAVGSPASVAVASYLKLLPALIALYWLGRREWRRLGRFGLWLVGLGMVQWVAEPAGTVAFLSFPSLGQVGAVNNLSPYAISPALWLVMLVIGVIATVFLAPRREGWPAAVALSVLATPRLLSYMLMALLAGLARPTSD
jgi:alpha-1,2-mannosyltransferase